MIAKRVLFVDDEPNIRMTLPRILVHKGYKVSTASSVAEAVDLINKENFDVLISDLNIGQPGDGFTVVSVMRRVQPEAVTFILTGYPDFESALQAIRSQVDDYLTKPADIGALVSAIEFKLAHRKPLRSIVPQRVPELLLENLNQVMKRWIEQVSNHPEFHGTQQGDIRERAQRLADLLSGICYQVIRKEDLLQEGLRAKAAQHGAQHSSANSRSELIVTESRLLQRIISHFLQENMLKLDLSTLIFDAMNLADLISEAMEQSLSGFNQRSFAA